MSGPVQYVVNRVEKYDVKQFVRNFTSALCPVNTNSTRFECVTDLQLRHGSRRLQFIAGETSLCRPNMVWFSCSIPLGRLPASIVQ